MIDPVEERMSKMASIAAATLSSAKDRITALEKENAELRADCQRKDELLTAAVDDYNDARGLALEEAAILIEQRDGLIPDRQEIARAIRRIKPSEAEGRDG